MNYRIKTKIYNDGRKEYFPQKRVWCIWFYVMPFGNLVLLRNKPKTTHIEAMLSIDKNYAKSYKVKETEVEYVVKGFFKKGEE